MVTLVTAHGVMRSLGGQTGSGPRSPGWVTAAYQAVTGRLVNVAGDGGDLRS